MATVARLKLGPKDHGRPLAYRDYLDAEYQEGFRYELIDGKLEVAALPRVSHGWLDRWLFRELDTYSEMRPEIINFVYNKTRFLVPGRPGVTSPQPDLAAYRDFPLDLLPDVDWEDFTPILVAEILSPDNATKDLVRNVELYWQVPTIREYWILDGLEDMARPRLIVRRRFGKRWRIHEIAFGETYTTKLLPEFELVVDPRR